MNFPAVVSPWTIDSPTEAKTIVSGLTPLALRGRLVRPGLTLPQSMRIAREPPGSRVARSSASSRLRTSAYCVSAASLTCNLAFWCLVTVDVIIDALSPKKQYVFRGCANRLATFRTQLFFTRSVRLSDDL